MYFYNNSKMIRIFSLLLLVTLFSSSCKDVGAALTGKDITKVTIEAGDVVITDDQDGVSNVEISCNNGLVIDADWKRNPYNEFGYDIYEPTVNMDYNKLAVMIMARGVIANYLRGEYD
jgi:hypothetical protein